MLVQIFEYVIGFVGVAYILMAIKGSNFKIFLQAGSVIQIWFILGFCFDIFINQSTKISIFYLILGGLIASYPILSIIYKKDLSKK